MGMTKVGRANTKYEAQQKAIRWIKPGHRKIKKSTTKRGGYDIYVTD